MVVLTSDNHLFNLFITDIETGKDSTVDLMQSQNPLHLNYHETAYVWPGDTQSLKNKLVDCCGDFGDENKGYMVELEEVK